jgi:hypothetical protein
VSLLYASEPVQFNSAAPSCDCLAHVYGNAADGLITEFHDRLRGKVREREGRGAEPTAGTRTSSSPC